MIVINSAQVASDLLESRSGIYSDRPKQWMYGVLANRLLNVFSIPIQHSRFRRYCKLMNSGLNSRATQGYAPLMESEVKTLLRALYTKPEELSAHVRRNAGAVILKVAYGWKVESNDDHFVTMMEKAVKMNVEANTPGKWLVEDLPARMQFCFLSIIRLLTANAPQTQHSALRSLVVSRCIFPETCAIFQGAAEPN